MLQTYIHTELLLEVLSDLKKIVSVVAVTFYFNVNTSERKTDLDSNAGSNGSIKHPNLSNRCPLCLLLKMDSDLPLVL